MITLLVLLLVGLAARRGHQRGAPREIIDLLVVVIGFPVAFRLGGPIGERLFGAWAPLASRTLGALSVFTVLALIATAIRRALAHDAPDLDPVERVLGALVGAGRGAILAFVVVAVAAASPAESTFGQAAQRSSVVQAVTKPDGLPLTLFEALTGEEGMTALIAFNRSFPDGPLVTDDFRQIPAFDDIERQPPEGIEILELVNDERQALRVASLTWSSALTEVAMEYAEEMYTDGFFAHVSERTGDVGTRLSTAGIRYAIAGENLALAPNVQAVHRGLMNSPGHRANIVSSQFTHVGIGVVEGPIGLIVVQVFLGGG